MKTDTDPRIAVLRAAARHIPDDVITAAANAYEAFAAKQDVQLVASPELRRAVVAIVIDAADAARGRSYVDWRPRNEWRSIGVDEPERRVLVENDDGEVLQWHAVRSAPIAHWHRRWAKMPTPPPWSETASSPWTEQNATEKPAPQRTCGIQDGCDNRARCLADGECHYTKSPLVGRDPYPVAAPVQLAVIDTVTGDRVGTLYRDDLPTEDRVAKLERCLRVVMERLSTPSLDADGRIGKAFGELGGA